MHVDQQAAEAVVSVLRSGQTAQGQEVAAFEREFAALCGTGHAVAVSSGTAALTAALIAAGVCGAPSDVPVARRLATEVLAVPVHQSLTDTDVQRVVARIRTHLT